MHFRAHLAAGWKTCWNADLAGENGISRARSAQPMGARSESRQAQTFQRKTRPTSERKDGRVRFSTLIDQSPKLSRATSPSWNVRVAQVGESVALSFSIDRATGSDGGRPTAEHPQLKLKSQNSCV